jgi:hypothetical protein
MKKNLIITGANTAREISSPKPIEPKEGSPNICFFDYGYKMSEWERRESSLKEYRIVPNPEECKAFEAIEEKVGGKITHMNYGTTLPVGTKVECETNEELLTFYIL